MQTYIHPTADVMTTNIGSGTRVWQFVVILPRASIGSDCNICAHTFIENEVQVGARVTIKSGVQLWDGVQLEDDVFIGPNVTFTNDKYPRSRKNLDHYPVTLVKEGASVGGGAVILPGITIGRFAMVGAGAVVTRSVPDKAVVVGNPARMVRWVGVPDEAASPSANSQSG